MTQTTTWKPTSNGSRCRVVTNFPDGGSAVTHACVWLDANGIWHAAAAGHELPVPTSEHAASHWAESQPGGLQKVPPSNNQPPPAFRNEQHARRWAEARATRWGRQ